VNNVLKTHHAVGGDPIVQSLTAEQRGMLLLLAEGHNSMDFAKRLRLSIKTVQTHREHIMERLGIHSVVGLTKYAIREDPASSDPDCDD
jgi:DNA-binding CsgD family transcriptional regulator